MHIQKITPNHSEKVVFDNKNKPKNHNSSSSNSNSSNTTTMMSLGQIDKNSPLIQKQLWIKNWIENIKQKG